MPSDRRIRFSLRLFFSFLAVLPVILSAETVAEIPNPRTADGSFVQDSGGVLGPEYIALIDGICRQLQAASGIELAVVTVTNLGGIEIEPFAEQLFQRFGIGQSNQNNGLLLLFSQDDRAVRIEVGYGLEGVIPDGLASRILDEHAVPWFRQGQIGRGLYLTTTEVARIVTQGSASPMTFQAPEVWPETIVTGTEERSPETDSSPPRAPLRLSLLLGVTALGIGLLGIPVTALRIGRARALGQKRRLIYRTGGFTFLMFLGIIAGIVLLINRGGGFLAILAPILAGPLSLIGGRFFKKAQRRRLENYHLPCRKCQNPMNLLGESEDDARLNTEEKAEERAGGMDYEIWTCGNCGESEKLTVKLGKADKCRKCKRFTLKQSRETLVAATTSHGGRVRYTETCMNPNCGFTRTWESSTPRLSSGGSSSGSGFGSSSSSRSSSGSSFGGGRSGGGGASKHW